ncbi:MAG: ABC transporter ATP-binding protein [Candidatus Heimdallarchaeota archaeon]|nr:ABC transporter ATP-binding protein [Candidatus Heimdallarchaeota archaeon]
MSTYSKSSIKSLELRDFSISYSKHSNAISNAHFTFLQGKSYLLTGTTASGKSSLLRFLKGFIPLFYPATITGEILLNGSQISIEEFWEYQGCFGFLFQDPALQTVGSTVEKDLAFGLENKGFPSSHIQNRIMEISQELGIEELLERKTSTLSGGEISLVSLASILILNPPFLLLDEFAAFLDYPARKKVLRAIKSHQDEKHTVVIVSHQLEDTLDLVDEIIVMDKGEIVLHTARTQILEANYSILQNYLNLPEIFRLGIPLCEKQGVKPVFRSAKELYSLLRRENIE